MAALSKGMLTLEGARAPILNSLALAMLSLQGPDGSSASRGQGEIVLQ